MKIINSTHLRNLLSFILILLVIGIQDTDAQRKNAKKRIIKHRKLLPQNPNLKRKKNLLLT